MPISPEKLARIQDLGLSEYEGRAYLALLDLGESTASQAARASRVPRTKIYQALEGLETKLLVRVEPSRPKRYTAQSLEGFLRQQEDELKRQAKDIADKRDEVVAEFAPKGGLLMMDPGATVMLRGRGNVTERILNCLERVEGSLSVLVSENGLNRLANLTDMFRDARERGVSITFLTPCTEKNADARAKLAECADILAYDAVPTGHNVIVMDGKEAIVSHAQPDDTHLYQGEDTGLWTSDGAMVAAFEANIDLAARHAEPSTVVAQVESECAATAVTPAA